MRSTTLLLVLAMVGDTCCLAAEHGKCSAPPAGSKYATDVPSFFPTEFHDVPVLSVRQETQASKVITFGLPDGVALDLPISSAILMNAPKVKAGKDVARPYNPISPNRVGSFDLLIKVYEAGLASKYADSLKPGDRVSFKQIKGNVKKFRYPFGKTSITMLAGGTGIAPMYQALHPLLDTPGDTTEVHLIYGNNSPEDIMLKAELDDLAVKHSGRFKVTYVVGKDASDTSAASTSFETGWIDQEKVGRLAFPPSPDTAVWVCGVDAMYNSLAGSRFKPLAAGSALHALGYTDEMVWRS